MNIQAKQGSANIFDLTAEISYPINDNWRAGFSYSLSTLTGVLSDVRFPDDVLESATVWEDTDLMVSGYRAGLYYSF